MTRLQFCMSLGFVLLTVSAILFLRFMAPSVLLSYTEPGDLLREPVFALMNPLRNRMPESKAEEILQMIKDGMCDDFQKRATQDSTSNNIVCESESEYPLQNWTILNRRDGVNSVRLYYQLERDYKDSDGIPPTAPMWIELKMESKEWRISNVNTFY